MQANSDTTNKVLVVLLVLYIIGLFVFYSVWIYPTATRLNTEVFYEIIIRSKLQSRCLI